MRATIVSIGVDMTQFPFIEVDAKSISSFSPLTTPSMDDDEDEDLATTREILSFCNVFIFYCENF